MKSVKLSAVLFVIVLAGSAGTASAKLIPSADRLTVYDTYLHVRWLADANLAGTPEGKLIASYSGVTNITPGGSMDYNTALNWLTALNRLHLNRAVGYLGHANWSLPTTPLLPATDTSCTSYNGSGGGSFGYGCTGSDMGSLFNTSLGIPYPNTAVPIPDKPIGPFHNFQPYLYWSKTSNANTNGFHTFSFNTGWSGSNIDNHYMYVLP